MSDSPVGDDLDLSGHWRAGIADEELRRTWYTESFDDSDFVDIDVPRHWRSHSKFGDNDDPLLYRRRFSTLTPAVGQRAWLHLDGVCSEGDVWLDETYLGNTEGAWVPHRFEVTDALTRRNDHLLGIEVASPSLGEVSKKRGLLGTWQDGPYVPPGWNPGGIWRPVTLRRTGPVAIATHRVLCTAATTDRASVTITCTLDSVIACEVAIRTTVGDIEVERRQPLARGSNTVTWTVEVPDPDLWWPHELGDQPLTEVIVAVSVASDHSGDSDSESDDEDSDGHQGPTSDRFTTRCGLRQISLNDWILTVNGERLFVKGVLAGPAACELGTAPVEVFTDQVACAKAAGCNLVRVHAHISADALYAEADRIGMLIWQDLPLYRGQSRSVRRAALATAQATVDRLGAHPSIMLWCGHDEPDRREPEGAPVGFGRRLVAHELPNWNRSVLDRSVKRALAAADPSRPVIGSSGTWPHPPSLAGTDTHLDLGWSSGEAEDLARVARTIPRAVRFVQITPGPSWPMASDGPPDVSWPPDGLETLIGDSQVDAETLAGRLPPEAFDSAEDWQRATRNYQAALIRTQLETLRRLKYRPTGGFTIAHLDDLRAVMSPSLIDHTGQPKPAYAALRRACAPVLVTLEGWPACTHPGDLVDCAIHVVNDTRAALVDSRLEVRLGWTGGDTTWQFEGDVAADSVSPIGRITLEVPAGIDRIDAELQLRAPTTTTEAHYTVPVHIH